MKPHYLLFLITGLAMMVTSLNGQIDTVILEGDLSAVVDTSAVQKEIGQGFFAYSEDNLPIPKKSLIYSFIFPGMGQAYNRRWWKLPFVYGAVGGIIYAIDFNQSRYRSLRDCRVTKLAGGTCEEPFNSFSDATLLSLRDTYDRYTQTSYMAALGVYGVIAIEAFVDGHLQSFDISDDLSMQIKPSFDLDPIFARPTVGVSFVVKFD